MDAAAAASKHREGLEVKRNSILIMTIVAILIPVLVFGVTVNITRYAAVDREKVREGYFTWVYPTDNYTTGGEVITASSFGLTGLRWLDIQPQVLTSDNASMYSFQFVPEYRSYGAWADNMSSDNTTGCTIDNVSLITCNFTTAHGLSAGDKFTVMGFTSAKYNGDKIAWKVDNTTKARWKIDDMSAGDNISRTGGKINKYTTSMRVRVFADNASGNGLTREVSNNADLSDNATSQGLAGGTNKIWRVYFRAWGY